ncbi:hypothetical protein ACE1TI_14225 [Alteribacillus sp. JSM 102045]|uniref:hypothetical protein n=1 Tax=Alteribacillus sp. JSM 102045 TaxID=1562101 RepID=UPI0035C0AB98
MQNEELTQAIEKFLHMIETYPDEKHSVQPFKNFLRYFLRIETKDEPLPTLEIMSVLKSAKPTIFYYLREQGNTDMMLSVLTNAPISVEVAKKRLNQYISSDSAL